MSSVFLMNNLNNSQKQRSSSEKEEDRKSQLSNNSDCLSESHNEGTIDLWSQKTGCWTSSTVGDGRKSFQLSSLKRTVRIRTQGQEAAFIASLVQELACSAAFVGKTPSKPRLMSAGMPELPTFH